MSSTPDAGGSIRHACTSPETDHGSSHAPHAALQALVVAARLHQVVADAPALAHQLGLGPSDVATLDHVRVAARRIGLRARRIRSNAARLATTPLPALALMDDGSIAVLAQCDGERVLSLGFDGKGVSRPSIEPLQGFAKRWCEELILLTPRAGLPGARHRFGLGWFVPSLIKHRRLLVEVLAVSCVLQVLALVSPLIFQAVMDKVLVHRATSTLDVLMIGLVLVAVFETALAVARTYVFGHTTSRIDVELGSRSFRHLMGLPLAYFQARRVGDSVARIRELESIRSFLTGNALTLVIDVVFSVVFVAAMLAYSVPLTLVVLGSLPLYAGITLLLMPALRRRLDEQFARGAENQALLVESITGIQTVKASALEPQVTRRWDDQLAGYVRAAFRARLVAGQAHEVVGLIGKLTQAATLWWGARLVMEQQLTVGMFIAFNLYAGRVAQPIMRIAQMWTDFQQTGLSIRRLADILDAPTEATAKGAVAMPALQGRITFDRVKFGYRPDSPPVLNELTLDVQAGEVVGIVGRSGSGKSTLTKLMQRLHVPEQGRVLVDGLDISLIDPAPLRRQIGVVLQDSFLFNRSVRDNIAIADPAAPLESVIRAARLAGAHEFIGELPQGYDTVVGEQGASLSGGQRQRIAIARALFSDPRILILDEATSALDYESEAVLHRNMAAIAKGRTVFIVAHRLSAVRRAHRIVVLDHGRIVEQGPHDLLLRLQGLYARLWQLQSAGSLEAAA